MITLNLPLIDRLRTLSPFIKVVEIIELIKYKYVAILMLVNLCNTRKILTLCILSVGIRKCM